LQPPHPGIRTTTAWRPLRAGLLCLALAVMSAPAGADPIRAAAADTTGATTAPKASRGTPEASAQRDLSALSYGCGWAQTRLADPAWRPFLSRVTRACEAIAIHPDPREITQQAYRERAFTDALDRAARGLDALYLDMWRTRLADESTPLGAIVALNDTGVFLALQHERVFRLADRIVLHYDAGNRTAWLR
jgi:hypothetical protein